MKTHYPGKLLGFLLFYVVTQCSYAQVQSVLHSTRIGSSVNLLSVIEPNCNQLDANPALNSVTFIHRTDVSLVPGTNGAQYSYDISKNNGATWTSNIGPITNDISIDNSTVNGRFPQAVIYNPAGNSITDSAYLVYS